MKFNVTNISKVVYLDSLKEYEDFLNSRPYDDFTLFIVKSSDGQVLVYYGHRRLKDVLVVDSGSPILPDSPVNKVYLSVGKKSDDEYFVKDIYYKYLSGPRSPRIAKFSKDREYLKVYSEPSEDNLWTAKVVFSSEDEAVLLDIDFLSGTLQIHDSTLASVKTGLESKSSAFWNFW